MIKKGSLYRASDKAFFDALCQHKMSKPALQELFWRRGVIIPKRTEKSDVARYFSRLDHDYFDHKLISEKVSATSNREKKTSQYSNESIPLDDIEFVARKLVDERKSVDNSISLATTERSVVIDVSYSYYDLNKPEFKQSVTKSALIEIETSDDGVVVRAPDNDYVSEITATLLSKIEAKCDVDLEVETISLYGIDEVEKKNSFFEALISGMENMELYDVSDVAVFNPDTGVEDDVKVHVKRASLNGEGVLLSGELKQFYKKGFFVYRISWSATQKENTDSDIYSYQAQFSDPEECRNFSYLVKGSRRYLGKGDYAKTPSRLTRFEENRMLKKLEKSAQIAKRSAFDAKGDEVELDESKE